MVVRDMAACRAIAAIRLRCEPRSWDRQRELCRFLVQRWPARSLPNATAFILASRPCDDECWPTVFGNTVPETRPPVALSSGLLRRTGSDRMHLQFMLSVAVYADDV